MSPQACASRMSATSLQPLSSFTFFPTLPFELRILIWKTTCVSRLVEVIYDSADGFSSEKETTPMPTAALQVCRESRNAVLNDYPLCFGSIFHPAKIRFNLAIDTLYIDSQLEGDVAHLFSTFREREVTSLRYLALDEYYGSPRVDDDDDSFDGLKRAVKSLVGLRDLIVVFPVDGLSKRLLTCGGDHKLELYDTLPEILNKPVFGLPPISELPLHAFEDWGAKVPFRAVYGWRRCPDNDAVISANLPPWTGYGIDSGDESDDSLWGGVPGSFGMGMFFPGVYPDSDSEMDDGTSDSIDDDNMDVDDNTATDENESSDSDIPESGIID